MTTPRDAFGSPRAGVPTWDADAELRALLIESLGPQSCDVCKADHMHEVLLEHAFHSDASPQTRILVRRALRDGHRLDEVAWMCCFCGTFALRGLG